MVAFNFQSQFVPLIVSGVKRATVRKGMREREGQEMQLYTGQRTTQCEKIGEAIIAKVIDFEVNAHGVAFLGFTQILPTDLNKFPKMLGFNDVDEMVNFYRETHGLPFRGFFYHWKDFKPC